MFHTQKRWLIPFSEERGFWEVITRTGKDKKLIPVSPSKLNPIKENDPETQSPHPNNMISHQNRLLLKGPFNFVLTGTDSLVIEAPITA